MSGVMTAQRPAAQASMIPMPLRELLEIVSESIDANRLDRAERLLGHVLAVAPGAAEALHIQGLIAFRRKRPVEAAALMERGLAAGGRAPGHLRNLSEVYRHLGRLDEALVAARQAVSLDPADPLGPFNLAMVHYDRGEIAPCISAANHSVQLRPNLPQAHMKLGQAHLIAGDFGPGWDHYEWRYKIPGAQALMPPTQRPQWDGKPVANGRLLLVADQGFGDVVMFARYVGWAKGLAPDLLIACSSEMEALLARTFPGVRIVTRWDLVPDYVAFCPFSGLPRLAGTRLDNIPAEIPYLAPDPARVAPWRARLDALLPPGHRRIGIAWAGRPTHNNDHSRSVALRTLAPLAATPGAVFVSLQKGDGARQLGEWPGDGAELVDLGPELVDFEDTVAVIDQLDMLVSVDTAIVHFAGAMGKPAWVMLPFAADWRWLRNRADTPWYPSLRLFRPPATRAWDVLVPQVAAALAEYLA